MTPLLIAASMTVSGVAGFTIKEARHLAESLPPPGTWSCEATPKRSYCCQAPAKLTRIWPAEYMCEHKTSFGFVDLSQPTIVDWLKVDGQ